LGRRRIISTCIPALGVALSVITACGSISPGGPLWTVTEGGLPNFGVGWTILAPGQPADMTAFVINSAQDPVTLVSASLIPIGGHPTGRLIDLAVARDHGGIAGHGWPPGIPFRPFRGARLPHGQSNIIFGFEGPDAGRDYLTAGVKIRYRYHGQPYTMLAWSSATACVTRDKNASQRPCEQVSSIARLATERLAAG
jgi:hypothetical protein